jgi:hypothetical protein
MVFPSASSAETIPELVEGLPASGYAGESESAMLAGLPVKETCTRCALPGCSVAGTFPVASK